MSGEGRAAQPLNIFHLLKVEDIHIPPTSRDKCDSLSKWKDRANFR